MIASEISANEYIDTKEYLITYETLAMSNDKLLLRAPVGEAEEDKEECEDFIQPPTRSELLPALPICSSQSIRET